nr:integrase, catalytic region, zinc finger, CCHC-type, peptidase aspartic, catalytic [Tanacetum cinerariifolium]
MAPKRTSTSTAPAMNQDAIRQLIDDRVADALEAQAANMENTINTNRNPSREKLILQENVLIKRVKPCPKASGSQPKSNHKTNKISPAKGANKLHVEDLPKMNKSHLRTTNRVDSSSRLKHTKIKQVWKPKHVARKITQVWKPKQVGKVWKPTGKVLTTISHQWRPACQILHLGCSKHMMGDHSRLLNFVKKFIGTVRFGNDHFGAITSYGDYVVGESVISRVKKGIVELFFVGTEYKLADLFTKALPEDRFKYLVRRLDTPPLNIQTTPETTSQAPTQAPNVTSIENINQAETNKENAQVKEDGFINIFSTPVQEQGETSSRYVDSSNMHIFYQRHPSEHPKTSKNVKELNRRFSVIDDVVRDGENLDKMKEKGNACIFVGYSTQSTAYRVYNKRTRVIVETIPVNFDELPQMASNHVSSNLVP